MMGGERGDDLNRYEKGVPFIIGLESNCYHFNKVQT